MNLGQIRIGTPFGDLLTKLATESETLVELGTHTGEGSTLCLARGLVRDTQRMWTVEMDEGLHKRAMAAHNDPRITFLRGRIVDEFLPFQHPDPTAINYYDYEKSVFISAPNVACELPPLISLLVSDAGEWSAEAELDLLLPRCQIVALDDCNPNRSFKNVRNRQRLIREGWTTIYDALDDRNGCGAWKRP